MEKIKKLFAKILGIKDRSPEEIIIDYNVFFNTDLFMEEVNKLLISRINLISKEINTSKPPCDRCKRYIKGLFQSYCPNCGNELKENNNENKHK